MVARIEELRRLRDGDVVVVTSKVVSKAEGRVLPYRSALDRDAAIDSETVREVARRGPVRIVENRLGLVMAAAGVDVSNLATGTLALLPEDPDASARRIRCRYSISPSTRRSVASSEVDSTSAPTAVSSGNPNVPPEPRSA